MATVAEGRAVRALPLRWRRGLIGELWAEFFGCFILISFGDGVVELADRALAVTRHGF